MILHLRSAGNGARTVSNRVCSLRVFLRHEGVNDVVQTKDIPRYTEKVVESYGMEELRSLFATCTSDQALVYRFFLGSGAREQEVMRACWSDVDWEAGLLHIRAKPDLDWTLKDHEERSVPCPTRCSAILPRAEEFGPKIVFCSRRRTGTKWSFLATAEAHRAACWP